MNRRVKLAAARGSGRVARSTKEEVHEPQAGVVCVSSAVRLLLFVASSSVAQVNTATLSGVVTDPQGLAVRGAKITATILATGAERTVYQR